MALGQGADEESIVLLRDLARQSETNFEHVVLDWIAAVSASPHPRARQLLLGFVDPEVPDRIGDIALRDDAVHVLAEALANVARGDRDVAARIFARCATGPVPQARLILAKVCANMGTPEALYAGLGLLDDEGLPQIPYNVWQAAERVFLEKRPAQQIANAYSLVPRAASDVRERRDAQRSRSAADLLLRIEEWRLEYGRPPSEHRHPAYDSGTLWPLPTDTTAAPTQ